MHLNSDVSSALQQFEAIKKSIDDSDDPKLQMSTADDLKLILDVLQDPVFRSIVQIQDSIAELNGQITQHPSILPGDFDITLSGDLVVSVPPNIEIYDGDYPDEQRVPSAQISPRSPASPAINAPLTYSHSGPGHSSTLSNESEKMIDNSSTLDNISHHQVKSIFVVFFTNKNNLSVAIVEGLFSLVSFCVFNRKIFPCPNVFFTIFSN